jgi:hypothetical protein
MYDPKTDSRNIQVPPVIQDVVGKPKPGTRMYEQWGSGKDLTDHFEFITETYGGTVSPGGVCPIAGVSRAAVYKRMKAGKLTAFLFHTSLEKGRGKVTPYCHIPVSEAKAWREEMESRTEAQMEALDIKKKDWEPTFMQKSIREAKRELKKRGIKVYVDNPFGVVDDE